MVTLPDWAACPGRRAAAAGAQVAHAGGRLGQAECPGGFAIRQVLEVPQKENLAVVFAQLQEGGMEPLGQLAANGLGRRSRPLIAQFRGQIQRRAVEELVGGDGPFPIDAPTSRHAMTPMNVVQPIAGDLPEPELKRQRRIAQVIGQPPAGLQQNALDHIAGILPAPRDRSSRTAIIRRKGSRWQASNRSTADASSRAACSSMVCVSIASGHMTRPRNRGPIGCSPQRPFLLSLSIQA